MDNFVIGDKNQFCFRKNLENQKKNYKMSFKAQKLLINEKLEVLSLQLLKVIFDQRTPQYWLLLKPP